MDFKIEYIIYFFIFLAIAQLAIKFIMKKIKDHIRLSRYRNSPLSAIDKMDGIEFERYLEACFREKGYDVIRTSPSNDYGADLILKKDGVKTTLQAKRYRNNVGISAVQEVLGARIYYDADHAVVLTNSYFTLPAKKLASKGNIQLIDRNQVHKYMLE